MKKKRVEEGEEREVENDEVLQEGEEDEKDEVEEELEEGV